MFSDNVLNQPENIRHRTMGEVAPVAILASSAVVASPESMFAKITNYVKTVQREHPYFYPAMGGILIALYFYYYGSKKTKTMGGKKKRNPRNQYDDATGEWTTLPNLPFEFDSELEALFHRYKHETKPSLGYIRGNVEYSEEMREMAETVYDESIDEMNKALEAFEAQENSAENTKEIFKHVIVNMETAVAKAEADYDKKHKEWLDLRKKAEEEYVYENKYSEHPTGEELKDGIEWAMEGIKVLNEDGKGMTLADEDAIAEIADALGDGSSDDIPYWTEIMTKFGKQAEKIYNEKKMLKRMKKK